MSNGTSQIVIITGNIGQDHDLKVMPNQTAVLNFSLATSESWKDKNSGEIRSTTEWHRCVAFSRTAENTAQYTGKGSKVQVIGKLRTRKWTDNNNVDRYATEIMVDDIQFLDRKPKELESQQKTDNTPPESHQNIPQFDDDFPG